MTADDSVQLIKSRDGTQDIQNPDLKKQSISSNDRVTKEYLVEYGFEKTLFRASMHIPVPVFQKGDLVLYPNKEHTLFRVELNGKLQAVKSKEVLITLDKFVNSY